MGLFGKLFGNKINEKTQCGHNYKLLHEKQNPLWMGPSARQLEGLKYLGKEKFSIPLEDCTCGCNGKPMTHFGDWEIEYYAYKDCPARKRRKLQAKLARKQKRRKETEKRQAERAKAKEGVKQERIRRKLELWSQREKKGLPALSRKEAIHRRLETYKGNRCKRGHDGIRLTKSGECEVCKASDSLQRSAMRRAEFPEDLNQNEREQILEIYSKSKRLSKETGIQHHVDHIQPLSKGGRHHPSNLQILTAEENLKKGDKWET